MTVPYRFALLGPPESVVRNIRRMVYCGGDIIYLMFVEHVAHFDVFYAEMLNVKSEIAILNSLHQKRSITDEEYRERVRDEWLHGVVWLFVNNYGEHCVTEDIRRSIGDVAHNVGEDVLYDWPEFQYLDADINFDHIHMSIAE